VELIKKIKETEKQARKVIEQAKAKAAGKAEEGRKNRLEALAEAKQERKKILEAAVAAAESEGLAEIGGLKEQAEKDRQQLHDKVSDKMAGAVTKVMDYLRG